MLHDWLATSDERHSLALSSGIFLSLFAPSSRQQEINYKGGGKKNHHRPRKRFHPAIESGRIQRLLPIPGLSGSCWRPRENIRRHKPLMQLYLFHFSFWSPLVTSVCSLAMALKAVLLSDVPNLGQVSESQTAFRSTSCISSNGEGDFLPGSEFLFLVW